MAGRYTDKMIPVKSFPKIKIIVALCFLAILSSASFAAKNKCKLEPTKLFDLVAKPKDFMNKEVVITGEFYSFSTIPLDYDKALRSSKDFIGLILARPDQTEIPLVELKLLAPLEMFKEQNINIEHGDIVSLEGKVYAVALGEPWLEITDIEIEEHVKDSK